MKKDQRDLQALRILREVNLLPFASSASTEQQRGAKDMIENEISSAMRESGEDQDLSIWITTGASKEIPFIRAAITELGGSWKRDPKLGENLSGYRCSVPSSGGGSIIRFALISASRDGKQAQTNLIHRIRKGSKAKLIILVGMMGGIPNRVDMLDVVIPTDVYDGTNLGTENGRPKWAVTVRPMHERFSSSSANFASEIAEEFDFKIRNTKRVVTTGGTIEDVNQDLFQEIVKYDEGEIIGMEMEGYAVVDASADQQGDGRIVIYGFVKAVADYGKGELPEKQINILQQNIPELKDVEKITPRSNEDHKRLIQHVATGLAFRCAIRLAEYTEFS